MILSIYSSIHLYIPEPVSVDLEVKVENQLVAARRGRHVHVLTLKVEGFISKVEKYLLSDNSCK